MRSRGLVRCTGRAVARFPGMAPRSARRRWASPACTHDAMPACVHARQRTARHNPFASIEITGLDPLADRIAEIVVGCPRGEVPRTASIGLRGTTGTTMTLRTRPGAGSASSKNLGKDGSAMQCPACWRVACSASRRYTVGVCFSCEHPGRKCKFWPGHLPGGLQPVGPFLLLSTPVPLSRHPACSALSDCKG